MQVLQVPTRNAEALDSTFRGFFGASISVITHIWNRLQPFIDDEHAASSHHPRHLLWSLVFLKIYSTEEVHCRIVGWPAPKTFRKWSWYFVGKIAQLKDEVILLDKRFDGYDETSVSNCIMSIDGIDCPVNEPWPFDSKWYSHKFNGPGVKYEVGVSVKSCDIVWINGPFVCSTNDATVFKNTLADLLATDEGVEVDQGYQGHPKFKNPSVNLSHLQRLQKSKVRGRHENVNARLKIYNVLNIAFRHLKPRHEMMEKHKMCFEAIAVITQLKFEIDGERLYQVQYDTGYF